MKKHITKNFECYALPEAKDDNGEDRYLFYFDDDDVYDEGYSIKGSCEIVGDRDYYPDMVDFVYHAHIEEPKDLVIIDPNGKKLNKEEIDQYIKSLKDGKNDYWEDFLRESAYQAMVVSKDYETYGEDYVENKKTVKHAMREDDFDYTGNYVTNETTNANEILNKIHCTRLNKIVDYIINDSQTKLKFNWFDDAGNFLVYPSNVNPEDFYDSYSGSCLSDDVPYIMINVYNSAIDICQTEDDLIWPTFKEWVEKNLRTMWSYEDNDYAGSYVLSHEYFGGRLMLRPVNEDETRVTQNTSGIGHAEVDPSKQLYIGTKGSANVGNKDVTVWKKAKDAVADGDIPQSNVDAYKNAYKNASPEQKKSMIKDWTPDDEDMKIMGNADILTNKGDRLSSK